MLAFALAAAAGLLFLAGIIRDRRSFSNAVLLGLALTLAALGIAAWLVRLHTVTARLALLAVFLLVALGPILVAVYLIHNGLTMTRRESPRPGNLLSLGAGLAIIAVIGLVAAAQRTGSDELTLSSVIVVLLSGYVSFLFVSYVIYAFGYGQLPVPRNADFVIVLGSGLLGGGRVPPLLASRLDRGRVVFETIAGRGSRPMLIVSGGKGSDEQIPEAEAMARYLTEGGFPADRIIREDQSRTTEENLINSKAIMDRLRPVPRPRCVIVTSNFHAFRAAMLARRLRIDGQATGARVVGYYLPNAAIREFGAVFLSYKLVNLAVCLLIVAVPVGLAVLHPGLPHPPPRH